MVPATASEHVSSGIIRTVPTIVFGTVGFVVLVAAYLIGAEVGGRFGSGYGVLTGLAIIGVSLALWRLSERRKV